MFQDPLRSLDPDLTIGESLAEPLLLQGRRRGARRSSAPARTLESACASSTTCSDRLPGELSGGQRQRVAVARALVTEPQLVILDEPVSALDSANRVQVLEILKDLRAAGVALVFISHDLGSVAGIADRVAVLYRGELVEAAPPRTSSPIPGTPTPACSSARRPRCAPAPRTAPNGPHCARS